MYGSVPTRSLFPVNGTSAEKAATTVKNDLRSDANPSLNLAGFHTTYMEAEITDIMHLNFAKNITHHEAYPAALEMENQCIGMVADLLNGPNAESTNGQAVGVSTLGSSEAILLSVLAAKRLWQRARTAVGKPYDRPNMVMSSIVHVCWKKAAVYFEIEERYVLIDHGRFLPNPQEIVDLVDENTILVSSVLGSTYTGHYEDVQGLNDLLEKKNQEEGLQTRIHVDAASGGFVAPFLCPDLLWDFRLPMVSSINVSGHKYGLVHAAVGWNIWRSVDYIPKELLFSVTYCGSRQTSFTMNFSKPAAFVLGQYYQFLRLGRSGYREVMQTLHNTAILLAKSISAMHGGSSFTILSTLNSREGLPIVTWRLKSIEDYDEYAIAELLKSRGWVVPAYTMKLRTEELKMLRIVVRVDFDSRHRTRFLVDLDQVASPTCSGGGDRQGVTSVEPGNESDQYKVAGMGLHSVLSL